MAGRVGRGRGTVRVCPVVPGVRRPVVPVPPTGPAAAPAPAPAPAAALPAVTGAKRSAEADNTAPKPKRAAWWADTDISDSSWCKLRPAGDEDDVVDDAPSGGPTPPQRRDSGTSAPAWLEALLNGLGQQAASAGAQTRKPHADSGAREAAARAPAVVAPAPFLAWAALPQQQQGEPRRRPAGSQPTTPMSVIVAGLVDDWRKDGEDSWQTCWARDHRNDPPMPCPAQYRRQQQPAPPPKKRLDRAAVLARSARRASVAATGAVLAALAAQLLPAPPPRVLEESDHEDDEEDDDMCDAADGASA
eukprot:TRINITY_DN2400_c0_g2_i1.p1 TRINITY_DN2400_c0_g2~~TRINITY_DN2400_c0_g2_i1.p1  ORF type:complete len:329 (+),score=59.98 TRINITY_DN2400_c0_g2_i1:78-989(+)